jgi:transcriptional regulator with XRE-family HTH domain
MIDAIQCRMARTALGWRRTDLAKKAKVAMSTVQLFEEGSDPRASTMQKIVAAFNAHGVAFPDPDTVRIERRRPADQIAA